MQPLSALVLAAFWVSCFAEAAMRGPAGLVGSLLVASLAALLPALVDAVVAPSVFRPDIAVAVDPLAPEARLLASGARAALGHAASTEAPVRLLVARAPGLDLRIDLNAVRSRAFAEVRRAGSSTVLSASQAALPPFTCGDETACIEVADVGDNARIVILPAAPGRSRLRVVPHRLNAWPAAIAETVLVAATTALAGWIVALGSVALPGGCALAFHFSAAARKQGSSPQVWTPRMIFLHAVAIAAAVANLVRAAVW